MRRTIRDLADARNELLEIQQEFVRLQKRIDSVRDCIADLLIRVFGDERPAMAALAEEELIEELASQVAARLGALPSAKRQMDNRYLREREAAAFLGVSVSTLQGWRSRGAGGCPPVTKVGDMVMYSIKALEEYMEMRTTARR